MSRIPNPVESAAIVAAPELEPRHSSEEQCCSSAAAEKRC